MEKYYVRESITKDGEPVKKRVLKLYSPFKEGVGYNFKYKSTSIKSYLGVTLPVGKGGLNDLELGRTYRISKMVYSDTNLLARRTETSIEPITRDELQESINLHRTNFVPFWKKLFDLKLIKTTNLYDKTFFCINPLYFNSTTYIPLYLYMAFQKELEEHIPKWVIKKYLDMQEEYEKNT